MFGATGCGGEEGREADHLRPDQGGLQTLIDRFDQQNEGEIHVEWRQTPPPVTSISSSCSLGPLMSTCSEVAWSGRPSSPPATSSTSPTASPAMKQDYLDGPLQPIAYEGGPQAGPWFTDAGMFYYRKDLLESGGFSEPPKTCDEIRGQAGPDLGLLIKFVTAPEQQKTLALESTRLPTLKSLYEDQEVLDGVPVAGLGYEVFRTARPRPVSPYYSDMSLTIAGQFNASLKGEVSVEQVLETLQRTCKT